MTEWAGFAWPEWVKKTALVLFSVATGLGVGAGAAGLELATDDLLPLELPPCSPLRVKVGLAKGGYWCPHPEHEVTEHWADDNSALFLACDCPLPANENGAWLVKK